MKPNYQQFGTSPSLEAKLPSKPMFDLSLSIDHISSYTYILQKKFNENLASSIPFWDKEETHSYLLPENDSEDESQDHHLTHDGLKEAISNTVMFCITDIHGNMKEVNDLFCNASGFSTEELLSHTYQSLSADKHCKNFWKEVYSTLLTGKVWKGVIKNKHKNGSYFWTENTITPIKDKKGYPKEFFTILHPIADQEIEKENKKQLKELSKVNKELETFIYSISHDLRAPIRSALGLLDLCNNSDDLKSVKEMLFYQDLSLKKLDSFIGDILNYARNSRLEVKGEVLSLSEMISDIIQQHIVCYSKVKCTINIKENTKLVSDKNRLTATFNNLISNAFKYQQPLHEQPEITIEGYINEREACITVKDNGIGIHDKHLGKIFDMFHRATDANYGAGIGLYIVKESIAKLKGLVTVNSIYGKGTAFTLLIPNLGKSQ